MDEGDSAAARSDPGRFIDQPVAPGLAFGQGLVEVGDAVADVVNARTAPLEKSGDRSIGSPRLEQLDLGFAEAEGNDARAVGLFRRMRLGRSTSR